MKCVCSSFIWSFQGLRIGQMRMVKGCKRLVTAVTVVISRSKWVDPKEDTIWRSRSSIFSEKDAYLKLLEIGSI